MFRYKLNYFLKAYNKTKPDVVVILGDLFDHGDEASDKEFELSIELFKKIYINSHDSMVFINVFKNVKRM